MIYALIPVPVSLVFLILYVRARKAENEAQNEENPTKRDKNLKRVAIIQPTSTVIAVFIAALSMFMPGFNPLFTMIVISGLLIALIGDVNNVDMANENTVMVGLIIFVFAYLTYGIGFSVLNGFHQQDITVGIVIFLIYVTTMALLWRGLGDTKIPILIYGLVMPFMVFRAASTFFGDTFSITQCILLTVGTAMLYVGDLEFGFHLFRKPNSLTFGPFLYHGGQLLVSLSPSFFGIT